MIKKSTIPVAPWKGLYLDGVTVPGGLSKAENVVILQDGTAERRLYQRTLSETPACLASKGLNNLYELQKADGTRYLFADVDNSDTAIAGFGSELITGSYAISAWSAPAGSAWGTYSAGWTHADGNTTPLVANLASVAATQYRVVVGVTATAPLTTAGNWAYTSTDSTYTWTNFGGGVNIIWSNKWTHSAGATTALTAVADLTPVAGQSYRISVYVHHTSGTGLSVYIGGKLAGTIASTGQHELVATFVTDATALRFVPSSDWVGYIEATEPQTPMAYSRMISVKKFLDPAGANTPANLDVELIVSNWKTANWYPEAAAAVGQSLAVTIGGVAAGTITESGTYTYDVTATTTGALTFTPTNNWAGTVTSASVRAITYGAAGTKTKIIGGTVTGTTDYDVSWADIKTDLTAGDTVKSQWTTLQDRAFRVDGINQNYWFSDASGYHSLGCPAPAASPVIANTTGGELTAGAYYVYYTYVKKDGLYVVEGNPSPSASITIAGTAITVTVVGIDDSDVTHIRIYRTLYNEPGSDAYLAMEVSNASGTYTLVIADDVIGDGSVLENNNDRPPTGKYILGAGSRLWLIDTNGLLHWSKLDYPEQMPGVNQQSFDPKDGDEVMGMCALRSNLLVFKRRRTWLMNMFSQTTDEDGNAALAKDVVSSIYGCIATGSIQAAGQESAIWLSAAGFILYDGGTFRNISGGDIQTGTPSRIQGVVDNFMKNDAEYNITSTYHSTKQLYHVNFLYRTGSEITSQRHFVYNVITDTWTEYVYRVDTTQARVYVTNIALGHDSLGNEIVLLPSLVAVAGTSVQIYQTDYIESYSPAVSTLLVEIPGVYSTCDSSDNSYFIGEDCRVHKVTSANVASVLVTQAHIDALSWPTTLDAEHDVDEANPVNFISDISNSRFYVQLMATWDYTGYDAPAGKDVAHAIVKITTAGVKTVLSMDTISGSYVHTKLVGMAEDSSVLYVLTWDNFRQTADPTYFKLCSMNITTGVLTDLYEFTGITQAIATVLDKTPFSVYEDDLYFFRAGNLYVVTGMASLDVYSTGIGATLASVDIYADSGAKVYMIVCSSDRNDDPTSVYRFYTGYPSSDTTWEFAETLDSELAGIESGYNDETNYLYRQYFIHKNSAGQYILERWGDYEGFSIFSSEWDLLGTFTDNGVWPYGGTDQRGVSWSSNNPNVFYCCGNAAESDGVFRVIPIWETQFDSSMTPVGTVAHIVSNFTDLGLAEGKLTGRVDLDTMSKYPTIGSFALEPDYLINNAVHVDDETTEPDGAVSRIVFGHPGEKTWNTTNDFDSTVEPWKKHRIDVGIYGQASRYSIKVGDLVGGGHGLARIRPPQVEIKVEVKP